MYTVSRSNFTTITTEGAILPADLLQRIADGEVEGLASTDYHLAPNERLNEAINRSWTRLLGVWEGFDEQRQALPDHDRGTTLTRERWLLILFDELGFGRLSFTGSLPIEEGSEISYPISHAEQHVPIHLITFRQSLDRVDEDRGAQFRRSPHSLLQEFLNRSEQHLWGIVSNGLRLRLLRDNASFTRAAYLEFDLEAMFDGELYADFTLLWLVCHLSRLEILEKGDQGSGIGDEDTPTPSPQPPIPTNCWLERWSQQAAEQGTRALDSLRDGVTDAIARLGRGFLAHPANGELRAELQSGELDRQEYFRQLLRLAYRLIFLYVAEDRNLLLLRETVPEVRQHYMNYYSLSRLRELAATRRSGPHPDLYRGLRLLLLKLRQGYEPLGLPGLGGFLFSERSTPALDAADIANEALLDAIRALTFTIEKGVRRPVDYKNLGAEELGSVYESLLELHPELNVPAAAFELRTAAGSERKTTGSYYTPTSLINSLLDTALEPVVAGRLRRVGEQRSGGAGAKNRQLEEAILNIKVVDPACGSGHFLIAAANRLARHLERIRTGDGEPSPEANRLALRDVVGRCIYGVDINEMSVELCRVALWMETLDPGKPLSFLDANIQCGNSLLGATPALLARGIPDEAFTPITGDDKAYCTEWKKRNRDQRTGQLDMFARGVQPWERLGNFAQAMRALETMAADTVADVEQQRAQYEKLVHSTDYEYGKLWADAWVAAFVWRKRPEGQVAADGRDGWPYPITEQVFREIERSPHTQPKWLKDEIQRLADEYQFFHWHLAFPQVFTPEASRAHLSAQPAKAGTTNEDDVTGWTGGFDVVLGNPPWERIKLQEKEWFASRDEAIATAPNAAARRRLIAHLPQTNPTLHEAFEADKRRAEGESLFVRNSGKYPLCGRGDVNTYTLFAELARHVQSGTGRVGVIVPSGIATDDTTKYFFSDMMEKGSLVSFYEFENEGFFKGAGQGHMLRFALTTIGGELVSAVKADFVFQAKAITDLADVDRHFSLSIEDIALLNPNTRTCPIFRNRWDAELNKAIYRRVPVLIKEGSPEENPWGINFLRMFDMSNDSGLFRTREQLESEGWRLNGNRYIRGGEIYLPLYESKMINLFDHRFGNFADSSDGKRAHVLPEVSTSNLQLPTYYVQPYYWVLANEVHARLPKQSKEWLVGFRNVTDSRASVRSIIISTIPESGVGNSLPLLAQISSTDNLAYLAACMSSFVVDYTARFKIGGLNLNFFIVKQLPILPPQIYHQPCPFHASRITHHAFLLPRVLELTYTAYDLRPFAQDCGYHGPPFRWDEERRFLLRCELDAAYFHLYGINRDDVAYIMDTFPIIRRKDEKAHGEYRTKRVILEIYDEMAVVMGDQGSGIGDRAYQSRLDPPPGHPDAAHPWDEAYLGPELPREQWWQEVKDEGRRARPEPVEGVKDEAVADVVESSSASGPPATTVRVPAPTLELKPPPTQEPKAKPKAKPALSAQPALVTEFTPPEGGYAQRLKRVMALGNPKNQAELAELIAALGDENANIRWLAGSSLTKIGGQAVVNLLAAYLQTNPSPEAQEQARKTLEMIAETSEEEDVQARAREVLARANQ